MVLNCKVIRNQMTTEAVYFHSEVMSRLSYSTKHYHKETWFIYPQMPHFLLKYLFILFNY